MSNIADELMGQYVLVHPELNGDPANKAGQVGVITGVDLENDNVYVGFGKNGQGLYGTDALLILRHHSRIKDVLQVVELNVNDHKALFQLALLQELRQSPANTKTAMSLAMQSETVRKHSMQSIENFLGRDQPQYLGR
ncbi:MAG TPA: hypothetical protein VGM63_11985 [Mucilaginibacter sp.]|jgi:hypothetical protein